MRRLILAAIAITAFASNALAQTVVVNDNVIFVSPSSIGDFSITVSQDLADNPTSVYLNFTGTHISYASATGDEGADVYLVNPGDVFTKANVEANKFPPIVTATGPVSYPPVNVGFGDFYLGINTGRCCGPKLRSVFGWTQLKRTNPIGQTLMLGDHVMSYDSPGIVVGTTNIIPEPASILLALFALPLGIFLFMRNR